MRCSCSRSSSGAASTIPVTPSRYLYTASWNGKQLPPLTHVVPAPTALTGARAAGQVLQFATKDPAYACLAGQPVNVFLAPSQFPDAYVVYHPAQGTGCPAGAWLFPQAPAVTTVPASTSIGARMTLQGTFPDVRPTDAVVHFLGAQQRVGQILSWSTTAIDVTVPADLLTGRYSLILAWHDPLTGAVVSSAATPVSLQVAGRTLPAIVSPAVKVLDQASLQQLDALPRAPLAPVATLTFRAPTPLLQSVQPGTILVAGISASTPYGLLRKVTGVSLQAGGLALQTTQASVLDAFQQGSFEAHAQVNAQSMPSVTPVPAAGACDAGFFDHLREQACLRSPPGLATGSHSGRCPDGELRQRMALAGTAAG